MKTHQKTFRIPALACFLSMACPYYRYTLHEHPADTFGAREMIGCGVCAGWSCLDLVERCRATRAIVALCLLQPGFAFLSCFPYVFATRHGRFRDWAGAVLFVGLIAGGGYRSVASLAAARHAASSLHPARLLR